jgi:5,10-methylenetetrahydromethanopterin reductase
VRLAFSISGHRSAAEAVALARVAEASGFDEIWITEDYCERGAYAVAGGIAGATTRVRVGIGVVNPWTRHPMLLAMEHAALDELAGGRAVLGLGASNPRWMGEQLGIPFERPLARLEEAVAIVRAALAGDRVRRRGGLFEVDAALAFEPRRRDAPVVLGVKGRKALGLAGRIADGVLLSVLSSPAYVAWARQRLGAPVEVGAYVAFACERDAAAARDRLRPLVATFLGVHGDHDITRVAGLPAELAGRFRDGWVSGAPRADLVTDELLDTFAVAGDRDDAAEGFRRLASAGVDVLIVRDDGGDDPAGLLASASLCFRLTEGLPG